MTQEDKRRKELSWAEGIAWLKDSTGRPGPSTWEVADYRTGTADHPVTGISWYEAVALARFVGKKFPTTHHWTRAMYVGAAPWMLPRSNLDGEDVLSAPLHPRGRTEVGHHARLTPGFSGNAHLAPVKNQQVGQ